MSPATPKLLCLSLCLLVSVGNASVSSNNPHAQILEATGMHTLLAVVNSEIAASARSHAKRCGVVARPIDNDSSINLQAALTQSLTATTVIAQAHEIAGWYRSAAGSKITLLEQQLPSDAQLNTYIQEQSAKPAWLAGKYPLFKRIYENTGAGAVNATMGVEIEYSGLLISGCIEKYDNDHPSNEEKNAEQIMADLIRHDKALMAALFRQDSLFAMAYTLRSLSDEELTGYAEFTDQHKDYYQSLVHSFESVLKRNSDYLAEPKNVVVTSQSND